jgi:hypothetical protein
MDIQTRENFIKELIDDDMDTVSNHVFHYMESILRYGFKGYTEYSDEELVQVYNERFDSRK